MKNMSTKRFELCLQSNEFSTFDELSEFLEEEIDDNIVQTLGPKPIAPWDKQQLFLGVKEPFFYRDGTYRRNTFFQCVECSRIFPDTKMFEHHERQHLKVRKSAAGNGGRKISSVLPFAAGELSSDRAAQRNSRNSQRTGRGRTNQTNSRNGNGSKGRGKKDRQGVAVNVVNGEFVSSANGGSSGKRNKGGAKALRKKAVTRLDTNSAELLEDQQPGILPPGMDISRNRRKNAEEQGLLPVLDASKGRRKNSLEEPTAMFPVVEISRNRRKNMMQEDLYYPAYTPEVHTFDEKDPEFRKPGNRAPSRKRKNGKPNGLCERRNPVKMMRVGMAPVLQAEDEYNLDKSEDPLLDDDFQAIRPHLIAKREPPDDEDDEPFLPPVLDDETALPGIDSGIIIYQAKEEVKNAVSDRRKKRKKKRRLRNSAAGVGATEGGVDETIETPMPPLLMPVPLTPNAASPVDSPVMLTPHSSVSPIPVTGRMSRGATDEETGSEGDLAEMAEIFKRNVQRQGSGPHVFFSGSPIEGPSPSSKEAMVKVKDEDEPVTRGICQPSQQSLPPPHLVVQKSSHVSAATTPSSSLNSSPASSPIPTSMKRQCDSVTPRINGHRNDSGYSVFDVVPHSPTSSKQAKVRVRGQIVNPESPVATTISLVSSRDTPSDLMYSAHDQLAINKSSPAEPAGSQCGPSPSSYPTNERMGSCSSTQSASSVCTSYSTSPGSSGGPSHGKKKFVRLSAVKGSDGYRAKWEKDRVYNPDEHCGVADSSGEPCKKSLTCKKHKINERRNVPGRSQSFDALLRLHREMATRTPDAQDSNSKQFSFPARTPSQPQASVPSVAAPLIDLGPNPMDLEEAIDSLDPLSQHNLFPGDIQPQQNSSAISSTPSARRVSDSSKSRHSVKLRHVPTLNERHRLSSLPSISKNVHRQYRWFHCWRAVALRNRLSAQGGIRIGNFVKRLKPITAMVGSGRKRARGTLPYSNIGARTSNNRRYSELTLLRQISNLSGVQTLPPRVPTELSSQQQQQQQHQQQSTTTTNVTAVTRHPESQQELVGCQILSGYPVQRQQHGFVPSGQHPQQSMRIQTIQQSTPSGVRQNRTAGTQGQNVRATAVNCRSGTEQQIVAGVNLVNSRQNGAGNPAAASGQSVYFEFQTASTLGANDPVTSPQQQQQQQTTEVGYPLIRGNSAPTSSTSRGISVRNPTTSSASSASVHSRRRPNVQQLRLPGGQTQVQTSQQQLATPARSSQHHVIVQQQTSQPQIIRRAASLSAAAPAQQQQQQPAVMTQIQQAPMQNPQQQQQQQQQQRYVRLVGRAMPSDYHTSLALATNQPGASGPTESDDDCQIIEMSSGARSVTIQPQGATVHPQRMGGQYPQMVHRVLPQQQTQQQASQQSTTGQIFRRVAAPSQVAVHRQQQQVNVQFASAAPHVVQVRPSASSQQPSSQATSQLESGHLLRQRILQQRHEEQQQQQIRQQVFQQQQQLSLDSQRQRSTVAVTSVTPSGLGEVYLQSRVQGHPSTLRRAGGTGVQSTTRVLTSAQAGGVSGGTQYRGGSATATVNAGDIFAVSSASDIGRQHSFQASVGGTDLQQTQVVESADASLYSPEPILPSSTRTRIAPQSMVGSGTTLSQQRLIVPSGGAGVSTSRRLLTAQYPSGVTVVPASALQQHQQTGSGGAASAAPQVLIAEDGATTHRVLTQPGSGRNNSSIPTVLFVEPDLSGQSGATVQQFATAVPQAANGSIVVTGQPRVVAAATTNGSIQQTQGVPAIRHRLVTHLTQHRPAATAFTQQPATPHM